MTLAVFDLDAIIYKAGFACEKRTVVVTNKAGKEKIFKNQTEFFGNKKNEIGGWLAKDNEERVERGEEPRTKEDFTLRTERVSEPIENVLYLTKTLINKALEATDCDSYTGFIGQGVGFRLDRSSIFEYKGDRKDSLRPLLKDEIAEYLIKHHGAKTVTGLEADDWCIIEAYKKDAIVIAIDKDAMGCPVKVFNPDYPDKGIIDCDCFGELELIEKIDSKGRVKKEVKGYGRKFFYYQVGYGDDIDCYRANSATDIDWGPLSVHAALNDAQNDREALQALKDIYQALYPTPKQVMGWRGDLIDVDWKYMLNENWDLARMRRWEDDLVVGTDVLDKFGLLNG